MANLTMNWANWRLRWVNSELKWANSKYKWANSKYKWANCITLIQFIYHSMNSAIYNVVKVVRETRLNIEGKDYSKSLNPSRYIRDSLSEKLYGMTH